MTHVGNVEFPPDILQRIAGPGSPVSRSTKQSKPPKLNYSPKADQDKLVLMRKEDKPKKSKRTKTGVSLLLPASAELPDNIFGSESEAETSDSDSENDEDKAKIKSQANKEADNISKSIEDINILDPTEGQKETEKMEQDKSDGEAEQQRGASSSVLQSSPTTLAEFDGYAFLSLLDEDIDVDDFDPTLFYANDEDANPIDTSIPDDVVEYYLELAGLEKSGCGQAKKRSPEEADKERKKPRTDKGTDIEQPGPSTSVPATLATGSDAVDKSDKAVDSESSSQTSDPNNREVVALLFKEL